MLTLNIAINSNADGRTMVFKKSDCAELSQLLTKISEGCKWNLKFSTPEHDSEMVLTPVVTEDSENFYVKL